MEEEVNQCFERYKATWEFVGSSEVVAEKGWQLSQSSNTMSQHLDAKASEDGLKEFSDFWAWAVCRLPHTRHRHLDLDHPKNLGGFSATTWTAGLRTLLSELGVSNAMDYHSHDILRCAAIDIFSEKEVAAMLQHCNWRSLGSGIHCVPPDEIQAGLVAQGFADESEPDS